MNIPFFIARRYIFSKKSLHFIAIISFLSILGLIVGNAALICVISIFNGFRVFAEEKLVAFDPHIRISAPAGAYFTPEEKLVEYINANPNVISQVKNTQGKTAIFMRGSIQAGMINAIEEEKQSDLAKSIIEGSFDISQSETPKIVLSVGLANKIGAWKDDTVQIASPKSIEAASRAFGFYNPYKAVVSGIFSSSDKKYDDVLYFANINFGRSIFGISDNQISSLDIKLKNYKDADAIREDIASKFSNIKIETWYDLHKDLFDVMRFERILSFACLSIISLIAVFNAFASLAMTVVEKKADISILRAIGSTEKAIRKQYFYEGAIIGVIGSTIGTILGSLLAIGQEKFGFIALDTNNYLVAALPVSFQISDALFVLAFSIILSALAAIYPARKAAKTNIIQGLRDE